MKTALGVVISLLLLSSCTTIQPAPKTRAQQSADPPTTVPANRWQIESSANELDHTKTLALNNGVVYLRCAPRFEGYVIPELPNLGHRLETEGGYHQTVRFRIDNGPLRSERWSISDNFEGLFIPTKTLRQVVKAKQLVIEYQPEYVTKRTMTLDLSGLQEEATSAGCKI